MRNQYLLHYVISGCGTHVVGGGDVYAARGLLLSDPPRGAHAVHRGPQRPVEYMWVAFDGFDVLEILRRTGLVNRYVVAVENGEEFARYLREMIEEFSGGSLFKVMSCFYGAMSVLEKSAHGGAYTREHEYVNKAIGCHQEQLRLPDSGQRSLARYIGIDRTYLYRIFLRLGEHVAEAVPGCRCASTPPKRCLLSGAYTVGKPRCPAAFGRLTRFCSRFKRCTGMTPKAFILNSRNSSQSSVEGE